MIRQRIRHRLFGQCERGLPGQSHRGRELGLARMQIILRLRQQEFRVRQVDVREADIERRFQPVRLERRHLIRHELPGRNGLLCNFQYCLRPQDTEVRPAGRKQDLGARRFGHLILRLRPQLGAVYQVMSPSEIRDQLADRETSAQPVVHHRIVQRPRREPAAGVRSNPGDASEHGRLEIGAKLRRNETRRTADCFESPAVARPPASTASVAEPVPTRRKSRRSTPTSSCGFAPPINQHVSGRYQENRQGDRYTQPA